MICEPPYDLVNTHRCGLLRSFSELIGGAKLNGAGKGVFNASLNWRERYPYGGEFTVLELEAMRDLSLKVLLLSDVGRINDLSIPSRGKVRHRDAREVNLEN